MLSMILAVAVLAADPKPVDAADYIAEVDAAIGRAASAKTESQREKALIAQVTKLNQRYAKGKQMLEIKFPIREKVGALAIGLNSPLEMDGLKWINHVMLNDVPGADKSREDKDGLAGGVLYMTGKPVVSNNDKSPVLAIERSCGKFYVHLKDAKIRTVPKAD